MHLTFTLSDGKTVITVPANGTVGTATVTAPDNVYVGTNDPVIKSIATVEGADVGKFEQLTLDKTPVSTSVTDEPGTPGNEGDLVKVTITADQTSVAENVKPTFHCLRQPAAGSRPGRDPEQQCPGHHQGWRNQRAVHPRCAG
ncbi:immunoglobulin-like domain-containing protein [Pseudomonas putida]|uniref:immunoglobulin-like domain-containing protein n=1 Tax=Pseudomonas putida TaxID=303 RepID=UPI001F088C55